MNIHFIKYKRKIICKKIVYVYIKRKRTPWLTGIFPSYKDRYVFANVNNDKLLEGLVPAA